MYGVGHKRLPSIHEQISPTRSKSFHRAKVGAVKEGVERRSTSNQQACAAPGHNLGSRTSLRHILWSTVQGEPHDHASNHFETNAERPSAL